MFALYSKFEQKSDLLEVLEHGDSLLNCESTHVFSAEPTFYQVREVHDGTPDFMAYVNSMTSLSSRIGTEVFILVVAVVMIVVGATEHKGCPANSTLPFYLVGSLVALNFIS